jgi:hypothetical protein
MPAQAGIQDARVAVAADLLDSRFRGNDGALCFCAHA